MRFDKRLLQLAQTSRFALAGSIFLGFAAGILVVAQARSISLVVGNVFLQNGGLQENTRRLFALLIIFLLRAAFTWGSEYAAGSAAIQIKTRLRQQLFEHILHLGPAYTREERSGELVNACLEGVEWLDAYFSQYLPQVALAALVPLAYLIFILPLDPLSGVLLLLTAPLIPLFMVLIGTRAESLTHRQWKTLSRLSAYFLDVLQGLTTLKALGASRRQVSVLTQASERYRLATMEVLRVAFLSALVLEMVATISTAVVAVEIGLRLLYGRMSFEQALFVLLLAPEFYLPLRSLGARFHAAMSGISSADRIYAILGIPAPEDTNSTSKIQPWESRVAESKPPMITIESLSYTYPDGRSALDGISLEIASGQLVALVGPSGAGKSTLASLLLRFVEPAKGEIRYNRKNIADIPVREWRREIAWVPQHPFLFNDTVAANLRLAHPDASLEEVIQAAKLAQADEFIQRLPKGYDTMIGERGGRLSAGQAQRIALGRAFLADSPILILDEPTSALDPEHEQLLQESITRLMQGRTVIVIAHRLNTVRQADRIYVLAGGKLVAEGKHDSLLESSRLYRDLVLAYTGKGHDRSVLVDEDSLPSEIMTSSPSPADTARNRGVVFPESSVPQEWLTAPSTTISGSQRMLTLKRLLSLARRYALQIFLSVLFGSVTIACGIGLMSTSAYIISAAALRPSIADLQVAIVGVRFFGIARGIFRYLERYASHQTTFLILGRLRVWFYQTLEPLAPARLSYHRGGDLLSRAIGDIGSLENFYVRALAPPMVAVAVFAGSTWFLSRFSPILGLNLLVFLLLGGMVVPYLAHKMSYDTGIRLVQIRSSLSACLVDSVQGISDLLASGADVRQAEQVNALGAELGSAQRKGVKVNATQLSLLVLLAGLATWTTLLLAIPLVESGQIAGVYLAVLVLAALTSFEAVMPLPAAAQYMEANLQAAQRLFELTDAAPAVSDPTAPLAVSPPFDLRVRELRFKYPDGPVYKLSEVSPYGMNEMPYAIDGLSLDLPVGKRLALVGASGAGKSTLVNLLMRFWEAETGAILLGEKDLRDCQMEDVRRYIALVAQNAYLFNASIRDNLLISKPDASEDDLVRAAKQARIYDFIRSLPDGFGTWIGEQGLRLSGGERQRLMIARALLRDSPLLILDEPTANLDPVLEREILQGLTQITPGRSILLITHRLVGLERMDEILVLRNGRLIERGHHDELIQLKGAYWQMLELQNQSFGY